MIQYVSYRPPPVRSRLGRGFIPRSGTAAAGSDSAGFSADDPPVVTELVHTPGYWHAYGTQSVAVGIMCLIGLVGILMGVTVSEHDKARGFAEFMVLPSLLMFGVASVLLVLFYTRFRKMAQVFDDADGEFEGAGSAPVTGEAVEDTAEVVAQHPNAGRFVHGSAVTGILAILVTLSLFELVVGFVMLFHADIFESRSSPGAAVNIFCVALIVQGFANLGLAYAIKQHRMRALGWVVVLSLGNVAAAVATLKWYLILFAVVSCALFWIAGYAFKQLDDDITSPEKSDPLEVYYHTFLLLLVHTMRADGHCDRRELARIKHLCNDLNLSDYERDLVIDSANENAEEPVADVIARYRLAADLAHIPEPAESLIVAAITVAAADSVLDDAEREAIEEIAKHLGVNAALYEAALATHAPADLSAEDAARSLLNITADTPADEIEATYEELRAELHAAHFNHLGSHLASTVSARLQKIDEAYELLQRQAPAPA